MKPKHTKGEWIANPHGVKPYQVWVNDTKIAACYNNVQSTVYRQKTEDEMHANTQLIAAAPELFYALQELVYQLTGEQECEEELEKGLGIHLLTKVLVAKAAIKKAIG